MARCGCASDRCSCNFIAGDNVIISGTGTRSNPYVVQVVGLALAGETPTEPTEPSPTPSVQRLTGEIVAYGGSAAPTGWLMCNGQTVSRGAFADLFAVIGTAYGAGDGTSTFALPDFAGRVPLGADSGHPRGSKGGSSSKTLTVDHLPYHQHWIAHTHSISHDHGQTNEDGGHTHTHDVRENASGGGPQSALMAAGGTAGNISTKQTADAAGSGHRHNVPQYNGQSGQIAGGDNWSGPSGWQSPESVDITPRHTAVNYLIKT